MARRRRSRPPASAARRTCSSAASSGGARPARRRYPSFLRFAFPPRCYYDVLRGLDYLRDAGIAPDERIADAVRLVEERRQADGRWLLDGAHDDTVDVSLGEAIGEPSRWNTLRALRVLDWASPVRSAD